MSLAVTVTFEAQVKTSTMPLTIANRTKSNGEAIKDITRRYKRTKRSLTVAGTLKAQVQTSTM